MKRTVLAFAIALLACSAFVSAQEDIQMEKPAKAVKAPLTFRVTGEAQAQPEIAVVRFTIVGDGDTLSAGQEQVKKIEQVVRKALEEQGVKSSDIASDRFSAVPIQPGGASSSSSAAFKPVGYRVQRDFRVSQPVSAGSLEKLMLIADAALTNGARPTLGDTPSYDSYDRRNVTLMEFLVKDSEKLSKQAMENGLARARVLAEQVGAKMGYGPGAIKLVSVQVSDSRMGMDYYAEAERAPITTSSWQPVKVVLSIEASFDVKQP